MSSVRCRSMLPTYSTTLVKGVEKPAASDSRDRQDKNVLAAYALQFAQELRVGVSLLELLNEKFHLLVSAERAKNVADLPHPLSFGRFHKKFFLARTRVLDIDGRVDPLVRELALQVELHVARALELLIDHLVHPAPRLDEGARDDRQGTAVLDVPGRAEELLGRVERRRIDTAGEDTTRGGCREIVGPREACDRV